MIHIEGLSKRYGDRILFEDVSWHVKKRDRIGLSGPNGSGKTTLLRMLAGSQDPDAGSIRMASETTIGYLPQDGIVHAGRTVYDEVVTAFEGLLALKAEQHDIEDQLERSGQDGGEHERLLERYAEVTEHFKALGGWEIEASVADVLKGLGFRPEDQGRRTEEFSGGWQMRIALAKLLLARPNLLLMDEPTNHLDLPARNWLEEYLGDYPGSVVLVSHDRYFLDATVKRITEVGLKTLTDYHGNYSKYVVEHAARMERLREAWRRQTEEIERVQLFITRFRYQATKAKQVQSRIKMLDKVERIELPPERQRIRFKFPDAPRTGRVVVELAAARKAYDANVVLRKVDLLVERGDRIAIVGPNGAGKSTLMRLLAGVERPDGGTRATGHNALLSYFAQDQAAVLNAARTVHEEMSTASSVTMAPMIRTILGGFLFSGDDVHKRVGVLSGGERNRLALAKLLLSPSNVLLLDEPTNHLDLASKEILLEALADYGGTLVFVSHDRYFVDNLATRVLEVGAGEVVDYPGGYEDFLGYKKRREAGEATPVTATPRPAPVPARAETKRPAIPKALPTASHAPRPKATEKAAARPAQNQETTYDAMRPRLRQLGTPLDRQARERELRRLKARIAELEQRIGEKERAVKVIEEQMAEPGFYEDRARAATVVDEREKLMWEVGDLMSQWEAVQAEAEQRQRA